MEGNQMEGKQVQGLDALGGPIWRATRCNLRHSGIPGQHQGCGYVPEPMDFAGPWQLHLATWPLLIPLLMLPTAGGGALLGKRPRSKPSPATASLSSAASSSSPWCPPSK
jgi:hypothetical protein